jgi:hypothetical protein
MSSNKNENGLSGNTIRQTTPAGAASGNPLKATDVLHLFPDEMIKHALSNSCASRESPLHHFVGLFEIAKGYIGFNEGIDEYIRKDFNTLVKSMDFYLELIKVAYEDDI